MAIFTTKSEIGQELVNVLQLKRDRDYKGNEIRYKTDWGNKTVLGIYETVKRIIDNKG